MAILRLVRTGHDAMDRNFDEIRRHVRDSSLAGKLGPTVSLVSGTNAVTPAIPKPSGRATVFISNGAVTISDVGLNSSGQWVLTASGPCTARFMWHE